MKQLKQILVLLMLGLLVLGLSSCISDVDIDQDHNYRDDIVDSIDDLPSNDDNNNENNLTESKIKTESEPVDVVIEKDEPIKEDLGGFGVSEKCVLDKTQTLDRLTNFIYIHGKNFLKVTDYVESTGEVAPTGYELVKDNMLYTWSERTLTDDSKTGKTFSIKDEQDYDYIYNEDYSGFYDYIISEGYICENWNYDSIQFELPGIEFDNLDDLGNEECSKCDAITTVDEKDACVDFFCS